LQLAACRSQLAAKKTRLSGFFLLC